jgi:hypothetical protein
MSRKCVDAFLHTGQRGVGTTLTVLPQIWQTKYFPDFLSISAATCSKKAGDQRWI